MGYVGATEVDVRFFILVVNVITYGVDLRPDTLGILGLHEPQEALPHQQLLVVEQGDLEPLLRLPVTLQTGISIAASDW